VYKTVKTAVERARAGEGPTLIEARYMRLLGHFVADDQWYRDLKQVEPMWNYEPLTRMRQYLESTGVSAETLDEVENAARKEIDEAISYAQNDCTEPPLETLYNDIYANGEIIV